MSEQSVGALLLGALSIAALHALIPSHWLAFALVGRAQRWTLGRTLRLTLLAGSGHVLMTVVLGLLLAGAGKFLWGLDKIPASLEHAVTSGALILLGSMFLAAELRGKRGCTHHHEHDYHLLSHDHKESNAVETKEDRKREERIASLSTTGAMLLGMTLSPCLDLLSIYVAASRASWWILLGISLIMALTTLSIMVVLVTITRKGLERVHLGWLERNEGVAVGGLLVALGALLLLKG